MKKYRVHPVLKPTVFFLMGLLMVGSCFLALGAPSADAVTSASLWFQTAAKAAVQMEEGTDAAPSKRTAATQGLTVRGMAGPPLRPVGLALMPAETARLDQLAASYSPHVSVYFRDITSGVEYSYDPDRKYFTASLIKAPYALYVYRLSDTGAADLNQRLTLTAADLVGGSGILKNRGSTLPREFSLRELLSLSIRHSDNTAFRALLNTYPEEGYRQFAAGLGLRFPEDIQNVTDGQISARDCGVYLNVLYDYMENGGAGALLKSDMKNTSYPLIRSGYPVARKYGWADGALHDMAVVYSPHPYLIAICTDTVASELEPEVTRPFEELPQELEALFAQKWAAARGG